MVIDIHAHTTRHKLWNLHVDYADISVIAKQAEENEIDLIVLMATYFPFKGTGLHNKSLLELTQNSPLFKVLGSLDVMNNLVNGINEIESLLSKKAIAGIKLYPGYQDFNLISKNIYPIYELAAQYDVPIAIHTGELHHCCPADMRLKNIYKCGGECKIDKLQHLARPVRILKAAKDFPKVNFILSHLGNPFFEELRILMMLFPNLYTDISGQFKSGTSEDTQQYHKFIIEWIEKFLKIPGVTDRLMFGTDFPIQSYQASLMLVDRLKVDSKVKEKIMHSTAARLLKLS